MPKKRSTPEIDGNHILYHYLQKDLRESDIWLFQMLSARLMSTLGIWVHPSVYQKLPILVPFAVRDPLGGGRSEKAPWGAPNKDGYFRDNNLLVRRLPKDLRILSPQRPLYHRKRIGEGFTAAHVWRSAELWDGRTEPSTRHPQSYSFAPNLVWLPLQVGKLSDREGSFSQSYLQAIAVKVYRSLPISA